MSLTSLESRLEHIRSYCPPPAHYPCKPSSHQHPPRTELLMAGGKEKGGQRGGRGGEEERERERERERESGEGQKKRVTI